MGLLEFFRRRMGRGKVEKKLFLVAIDGPLANAVFDEEFVSLPDDVVYLVEGREIRIPKLHDYYPSFWRPYFEKMENHNVTWKTKEEVIAQGCDGSFWCNFTVSSLMGFPRNPDDPYRHPLKLRPDIKLLFTA